MEIALFFLSLWLLIITTENLRKLVKFNTKYSPIKNGFLLPLIIMDVMVVVK